MDHQEDMLKNYIILFTSKFLILLILVTSTSYGQELLTSKTRSFHLNDEVEFAAVNASEEHILAGDVRGNLRGWSLADENLTLDIQFDDRPTYAEFLNDARAFVVVKESGQIQKLTWPQGTRISSFHLEGDPERVALSAGRRYLGVFSEHQTLGLFDLKSERQIGEIDIQDELDNVKFIGFDRPGKQILSISDVGKSVSWNPATQRRVRKMEVGGQSLNGSESKIKSVSSHRMTNAFVAGIEEVSLPSGGVRTSNRAQPGQLNRRDWVIAYDLQSGRRLSRFQYPHGEVETLGLGPEDNYAVAVGSEKRSQAMFINLRQGKIVQRIPTDADITLTRFSENGKLLIFGTEDGKILIKELDINEKEDEPKDNLPSLEPDLVAEEKSSELQETAAQDPEAIVSNEAETTDDQSDESIKRPKVDTHVPKTNLDRPNDVAVIIGNKSYENKDITNVDYAIRDAKIVKKYVHKTLGFRGENIIYVENASGSAMTRIFGTDEKPKGQIYNWIKNGESEIFVYYSGHGAPDPESEKAYFVPSNANPNYLEQNGYPVDQLYENLAQLPAESITVVLEACFSGTSEGGAVVQEISPAVLSVENPVMAMENGLAITAGTADQVSTWYTEKKHGLFTYYFLKALRGSADKDENQKVTLKEIKTYLSEKVPYQARRMHNREQTPQVVGQDLDRVLVNYGNEGE